MSVLRSKAVSDRWLEGAWKEAGGGSLFAATSSIHAKARGIIEPSKG